MENMKNLHILPTDKPSRLWLSTRRKNHLIFDNFPRVGVEYVEPQHIYITNNEEIKEGDCSFYPPFGLGRNIIINGELCFHIEVKNGVGSFTQKTYQTLDLNKKIILTTDQDLIKDGVQAIDDDFLEWFVKNPSCEEVEIEKYGYMPEEPYEYKIVTPKEPKETIYYCKQGEPTCVYPKCICNTVRPKEEPKLNLEKEMFELEQELDIPSYLRYHNSNPKQETLEEAAVNCWAEGAWDNRDNFTDGFIEGAKSDAARDYWFEQFKKKV